MRTTDIREHADATPHLSDATPHRSVWMAAMGCALLTGAVLGILFAPARGRDVRREIIWNVHKGRERASKLRDRASRLIDRGRRRAVREKGRVDDLAHTAGQHAGEIQAGIANAMHDAKTAFERGRQQALGR